MRRTWRLRRRARARREGPSVFRERSGRRKDRNGPGRWSAIEGWSSWLDKILVWRFELLLQLLLGTAHFVDEFFEARVILFAGFRFQAAGYIDPVGMNDTDCFRDIFHFEAAGENYAVRGGGAAGEVPVGSL